MRRWEFKRPILGRLVWGWLGFAGLAICGFGWLMISKTSGTEVGKIALNVDGEIDRLAPPEPLRLSPPSATNPKPAPVTLTLARNAPPPNAPTSDVPSTTKNERAPQTPNQNDDQNNFLGSQIIGRDNVSPPPAKTRTTRREPTFKSIKIDPNTGDGAHAPPGKLTITIDGRDIDAPPSAIPGGLSGDGFVGQDWVDLSIREPLSSMTQASSFGPIPKVSDDGRRAATWYARPYDGPKDQDLGQFGIIITGLGLNRETTLSAINMLPGPVTLSFAPYGEDLETLMSLARKNGHEVMLELPMEGYGADPERTLGPAGLLTSRTASENRQRLDWILSRAQGYFGVTNYQGAKFVKDPQAMVPVLRRLTDLGVAYVDDTGLQSGGAGQTGPNTPVLLLSGTTTPDTMTRAMAGLVKQAETGTSGIAKIAGSDKTILALSTFLTGLSEDDAALAPVSAVLYGQR